jgi:hypothetical protein
VSAVSEHRFADSVRRIFGLRESSALELIPDVMPVAPVLDATDAVSVAARREREAGGYITAVGVAAQWQHACLLNPSNSGVIMVAGVEWWGTGNGCQAGVAGESTVVPTLGNLVGAKAWRDSRLLLTTAPVGVLRYGNTGGVSIGGSSLQMQVRNDAYGGVARCILVPGTALLVDSIGVNETLRAQFSWTERLATPDDLRPPAA